MKLLKRIRRVMWSERNIYSDSLATSLWTIAGRSPGFFIPFLVANLFGVNQQTDLFFFSLAILQYSIFVLVDTPRGVMAPFLAERSIRHAQLLRFANSLLWWNAAGVALILAAVTLSLRTVLSWTTPYSPAAIHSIIHMLAGGSVLILLAGFTGVFASTLNYFKRFRAPAFSPGIRSAVVLATMVALKAPMGIYAVVLGYVLGEACSAAFLYDRVKRRVGFGISLRVLPIAEMRPFYRAALFQILAAAVGFANLLITQSAASHLRVGSVTLVQYASVIYYTLNGIFIVGLGTVLSSYWAESYHVHGHQQRLPQEIRRVARRALVAAAAVWLAFVLVRGPVTTLLFGYGRVPSHLLRSLADLSGLYSLLLVCTTVRMVFTRYFIIIKHTGILACVAAVELAVNLLACFWLVPRLGVAGVVVAILAYTGVGAVIIWLLFEHRTRLEEGRSPAR